MKRKITLITALVIVLCIVFISYFLIPIVSQKKDMYTRTATLFEYSTARGDPHASFQLRTSTDTYTVYHVTFDSRPFLAHPIQVAGLLYLPHTPHAPGIVVLPGGGQTKESDTPMVSMLAAHGYAVFVIDQRGIGETGGNALPLNADAELYAQGTEPQQHLMVFDALRAFDVISQYPTVDKGHITILGESMGGRYAIIAASMEPRISNIISISTSGFHQTVADNSYGVSIDADQYISRIAPRRLTMLHGTNDSVIPIEDARETFAAAQQPKQFLTFPCRHGYYPAMDESLLRALNASI
jgi:dienelactone hydrolase